MLYQAKPSKMLFRPIGLQPQSSSTFSPPKMKVNHSLPKHPHQTLPCQFFLQKKEAARQMELPGFPEIGSNKSSFRIFLAQSIILRDNPSSKKTKKSFWEQGKRGRKGKDKKGPGYTCCEKNCSPSDLIVHTVCSD